MRAPSRVDQPGQVLARRWTRQARVCQVEQAISGQAQRGKAVGEARTAPAQPADERVAQLAGVKAGLVLALSAVW
jgi:hypothetical protein